MTLVRATDRAIARENADPQGLPADIVAGMEADIRANPDRYPLLHGLLTDAGQRRRAKAAHSARRHLERTYGYRTCSQVWANTPLGVHGPPQRGAQS